MSRRARSRRPPQPALPRAAPASTRSWAGSRTASASSRSRSRRIYFRLLFGVSPTRGTLLIGPGAGLGLCVGVQCIVVEGDLPVVADSIASGDDVIEYRPVNISVRAQLRPDWSDVIVPGISIGLLTRIGAASVQGTGATQTVSNLGLRGTVEVAWRFYAPFEWVLEGGLDLAFSRATFVRVDDTVLLEDEWTPWIVTSLRLRPAPR